MPLHFNVVVAFYCTVAALAGSVAAMVTFFHVMRRRAQELALANVALRSEIAERQRVEADLRVAKEAADGANRAKSRFLANMSHEIRTPLGAVIGFSELLVGPEQSHGDRVECISTIRRNGELLSNIINDILDLSKVEAGTFQVDRQEVDLVDVVTDISSLLGLQAKDKGILLSVGSEGSVPQRIVTDSLRLRRVLVNIIGNAIKFTQRGEVDVRIRLQHTDGAPPKLAFVVRDTGPGIPADIASRLFGLFSQGEQSSSGPLRGTGLGLVLSRRLAQLLGGDVALTETRPGRGSTFTVTVDPGDVAERRLEEYRPKRAPTNGDATAVRLDGAHILVVDDSHDNQVLITRFLTLAGARVEVANDGREGMIKAESSDFDVVIMDIQMPVMDGYEAVALLRGKGYSRPILALTAHALKDEQRRCLNSGFDSHLSKPVNRSYLLEVVAKYSRPAAFPHGIL